MKSIKFKNFRCFKDFPEMIFNNITILVGGNSSGKSTITKAILLCIDNLIHMKLDDRYYGEKKHVIINRNKPIFRFGSNDVNIKSFKRAYYYTHEETKSETHKDDLSFEFQIKDFKFSFILSGDVNDKKTYAEVESITIEDLSLHVRYFHDYEHNVMSYEVLDDYWVDVKEKAGNLLSEYKKHKRQLNKLYKYEYCEDIPEIRKKYDIIREQIGNFMGVSNIDELTDRQIYKNLNYIINRNIFKIITPLGVYIDNPSEKIVLNVINNINFYSGTILNKPKSRDKLNNEEWENYYNNKKNIDLLNNEILLNGESFFNSSYKRLSNLLNNIDIEYISAHSVHQRTLYNTSDGNDKVAEAIYDYYNVNICKEDNEYEFIIKWMKKFKIGIDFDINEIDGEVFTLNIHENNGNIHPLSDKGIGTIQLMILLLRLATILRRYQYRKPMIIVEEPELNMHPNFQSNLADLFNSLKDKCNFIIETHSEYLVRKTQVLVARENFKDESEIKNKCPFTVYFIHTDDEPYDLEYTLTGRFKNKFGTGFYDESGLLTLEILRKERSMNI